MCGGQVEESNPDRLITKQVYYRCTSKALPEVTLEPLSQSLLVGS